MNPKQLEALKFLGMHLVCGLAAAIVFGSAILYLDISHIRTLALASSSGAIIFFLLYFGLFVTFGGIARAGGIMSLGNFSEDNRYLRDADDQ
jgi:hypothetical protein